MPSALWQVGSGQWAAAETVSDPRQCAGAQPDQEAGCVSGCTREVVDIVLTDEDHPAAILQMRGHPTTVHRDELTEL